MFQILLLCSMKVTLYKTINVLHLTALVPEVSCGIFHLWCHDSAQKGKKFRRFQMFSSEMFDLYMTVILKYVSFFASFPELQTNITEPRVSNFVCKMLT